MAKKRITICLMCVVVTLAICSTVRAEEAKGSDAKGNSVAENAFREAIADLTKAIELDPDNSDHWRRRADMYFDTKQWDKARADFSKIIELEPNQGHYWHMRGVSYLKLGEPNKAIADYSKAIKLEPNQGHYWHMRGVSYLELGEPNKAIADYSKAIELKPNWDHYRHMRGVSYMRLNQPANAVADYTKAIELNPENDHYRQQRIRAYRQLGQRDEAIADSTKAIELEPENDHYRKQRTEAKIPAPGFRPESDHSGAFLSSIGSCQMVVFPTVVRRKSASNDGVIMSSNKASQQAILEHLTKKNIAESNACMTELDLNWTGGESQWEFFESSMKLMAEQVKQSYPETDYYLAIEIIIVPRPNSRLAVFGIHVYILDQAGHNAFSFLLNSHHQLFVGAKLNVEDSSKESIEKLIADSTQVALKALEQQIQLAK